MIACSLDIQGLIAPDMKIQHVRVTRSTPTDEDVCYSPLLTPEVVWSSVPVTDQVEQGRCACAACFLLDGSMSDIESNHSSKVMRWPANYISLYSLPYEPSTMQDARQHD
jgi:hypothetical protein